MKTIYLDMDGVLCDFDGAYNDLFGIAREKVSKKQFRHNWVNFVKSSQFEKLKMLPSARDLLNYVESTGLNVEILSSSGGEEFHTEVTKQKKKWLSDHGINFKANIVPGGLKKAAFAGADTILVDDTPRVIDAFSERGGSVALHDHRAVHLTIAKIEKFIAT